MRFWYDCEFLEDGRTVDLISIGLLAEDGRELYLVNEDIGSGPLYDRIRGHAWLMQNVVPSLPLAKQAPGHFWLDGDAPGIVSHRFIGNLVRDFLLEDASGVELWAWYGAYDHVALAQLFGPMVDLPEGIPMYTHDMQQELDRRGITEDRLPDQVGTAHNALDDARHLKAVYEHVTGGSDG